MKFLKNKAVKPWGCYYDLAESPGNWHLKIIEINKGCRLSLQKHKKRSESYLVVEGRISVVKGTNVFRLKPGGTISIRKGEMHRIKGLSDARLVEVSFGQHDENDIVRIEDDYGRVPESL